MSSVYLFKTDTERWKFIERESIEFFMGSRRVLSLYDFRIKLLRKAIKDGYVRRVYENHGNILKTLAHVTKQDPKKYGGHIYKISGRHAYRFVPFVDVKEQQRAKEQERFTKEKEKCLAEIDRYARMILINIALFAQSMGVELPEFNPPPKKSSFKRVRDCRGCGNTFEAYSSQEVYCLECRRNKGKS